MRYIYKTVSLADFLAQNKDAKIGLLSFSGYASTASMAVERLINHFAKDGWEYVKSEEFYSSFFKSQLKNYFDNKSKQNKNPRIQMFVFRQPYSEELQVKLAEEELRQLEEARENDKESVIALDKTNPNEINFSGGLWVYRDKKFSKRSEAMEYAGAEIRSQNKASRPAVQNASCPNCEAMVNKLDEKCWRCNALFIDPSVWRPLPLEPE
jgi:hypothetical protein